MTRGTLPPVAELLPQRGAMCLLSRVLSHDGAASVCEVQVDRSALFRDADGRVPAFVALEYMAQCAAAHGSLAARGGAGPARAALFLGTRRVRLAVDAFQPGQVLHVRARHRAGERGLVAFDCEVRDASGGAPLAAGRVNVYAPPRLAGRAPGTAGGAADARERGAGEA